MITEVDYAWAAGFIDGEGCLYYQGRTPCLTVSQSVKAPLAVLRQVLGDGAIYRYERTTPAGKATEMYHYYLGGRKRLPVILQMVLPYLLVKGAQAQEMVDRWPPEPPPDTRTDKERLMELLVERIEAAGIGGTD